MMLRYSFDMGAEADLLEASVNDVLAQNIRTGDIAEDSSTLVGTDEMGDAVIASLEKLKAAHGVAA